NCLPSPPQPDWPSSPQTRLAQPAPDTIGPASSSPDWPSPPPTRLAQPAAAQIGPARPTPDWPSPPPTRLAQPAAAQIGPARPSPDWLSPPPTRLAQPAAARIGPDNPSPDWPSPPPAQIAQHSAAWIGPAHPHREKHGKNKEWTEVHTLTPLNEKSGLLTNQGTEKPITLPGTPKPSQNSLFGSMTEQGLPICLVCVCIGTSVYCDDVDLTAIPPLPKDTAYFYARFNRITRINNKDFKGLNKLKRVDLSSNFLSNIDDDAIHLLPSLQELILSENQLKALPELPSSLILLDAQYNQLQSSGIQTDVFKNNNIQTMNLETFCESRDPTFIRRNLEDIRVDENPINLSKFVNGYFCLVRLPTGSYY
uniref:Opticin n=1 Tax=Xenopus tropicalis TaxID=8364 RepID=A0A803J8A0_XENTR